MIHRIKLIIDKLDSTKIELNNIKNKEKDVKLSNNITTIIHTLDKVSIMLDNCSDCNTVKEYLNKKILFQSNLMDTDYNINEEVEKAKYIIYHNTSNLINKIVDSDLKDFNILLENSYNIDELLSYIFDIRYTEIVDKLELLNKNAEEMMNNQEKDVLSKYRGIFVASKFILEKMYTDTFYVSDFIEELDSIIETENISCKVETMGYKMFKRGEIMVYSGVSGLLSNIKKFDLLFGFEDYLEDKLNIVSLNVRDIVTGEENADNIEIIFSAYIKKLKSIKEDVLNIIGEEVEKITSILENSINNKEDVNIVRKKFTKVILDMFTKEESLKSLIKEIELNSKVSVLEKKDKIVEYKNRINTLYRAIHYMGKFIKVLDDELDYKEFIKVQDFI